MVKKVVILALIFLFLYGCTENSNMNSDQNSDRRNPMDDPMNITEEEANAIALRQAVADGYESPTLWEEDSTKINTIYSVKYDRDTKVYEVKMSTPGDFFGVFYYVSTESGEIIESNH